MEAKILSTLAKVAGIGGIVLGVFFLLFKGVLETKFLPQAGLNLDQGFAIIFAILIFTFGIAGIGIIAWIVSRTTEPKNPVSGSTLGILASLVVIVLVLAIYEGAQAQLTK